MRLSPEVNALADVYALMIINHSSSVALASMGSVWRSRLPRGASTCLISAPLPDQWLDDAPPFGRNQVVASSSPPIRTSACLTACPHSPC